MKQKSQTGFSMVEAIIGLSGIIVLVVVGVVALQRANRDSDSTAIQNGQAAHVDDERGHKTDDRQPSLHNLGGIQPSKDMKQDMLLIDSSRNIEVQSYLFGQKITHMYQPDKISTGFDFRGIARQIDIIAPLYGTVIEVEEQRVTIAPNADSRWYVILDHIVQPRVKKGDVVTADQVIGKAAAYQHDTFYYALRVDHLSAEAKIAEYVCPSTLLIDKVRQRLVNEMNQMTASWTAFRGRDFYGSHDGGCVVPVLDSRDVDTY